MTDQAETDESSRQEAEQLQQASQEFSNKLQGGSSLGQKSQIIDALNDFSARLGVPVQAGDTKLNTKEEVIAAMVQRAVQAGKSEEQITKAIA